MKRLLTSLTFLVFATSLSAEVIKIKTASEAREKIDALDPEKTLIFYDIDYTLLMPTEPMLQLKNIFLKKDYKEAFRDMRKKWGSTAFTIAFHQIWTEVKFQAVEEDMTKQVNDLKKKGFKSFGFTASHGGDIGEMKDFASLRGKSLKEIGIDFSGVMGNGDPMILDGAPKVLGHHPFYKKGILYQNDLEQKTRKGVTMVEFLKSINLTPNTIVMFDDHKGNLTDIDQKIQAYNKDKPEDAQVTFIGFYYTAAYQGEPDDLPKEDFVAFMKKHLKKAKETQIQIENNLKG